ncbi:GNAT family N-acetyltransferase [Geodermatophilus maliterrae]|uniref:GNAT family N-acetyltransferase n=1 Tax=Geodermatophilus maliterrae TaxID=3162531 RepID=A0ABV3XKZ3_9ACTN
MTSEHIDGDEGGCTGSAQRSNRHAGHVEAVLSVTTAEDEELRPLIAAQETEVMARYGVHDAGPGLTADTLCLIARVDDRPVGCVALGSLGDGVGEVKRMYVDPSARGHRIGRLLLNGVEELASLSGYRALRLEAGTGQPEALRLYEGAGWSRIECYGYFKNDPTTICYEKAVTRVAGGPDEDLGVDATRHDP